MAKMRDTDQILRDLQHEQAQLARSMDELAGRLAPRRAGAALAESLSAPGADLAGAVLAAARRNPGPSALIGLGAAWLAVRGLSGDPAGAPEETGGKDDEPTRRTLDRYAALALSQAMSRADALTDAAGEDLDKIVKSAEAALMSAGERAKAAGEKAQRSKASLDDALRERPVLCGALALAAGAALGAALPRKGR